MRRTTIISSALLALLLPKAGPLFAEDVPSADLTKRIEALEKTNQDLSKKVEQLQENAVSADDVQGVTNALESYKYQNQRDRETKTATSTRALLVGGTVQVQYGVTSRDRNRAGTGLPPNTVGPTNPTVTNDRQNSFGLGAANVFFTGNLFRDYAEGRNLTYRLQLGAVSQAQGNSNWVANVQDAWVEYSPFATTSQDIDKLGVRLGQQTLPFGLEINTTDELKPTIATSMGAAAAGLGRQNGLILRGDTGITYDYGYNYRSSLFAYNLGVVNGNGTNITDDNNYKDIVARIEAKIPSDYDSWLREIRIGLSGYRGETQLTATTTAGVLVNQGEQGRKDRVGYDVYYNHYPFSVTYEYILLIDDKATAPTAPQYQVTTVRGDSHTVTFSYSIGQQFLTSQRNQGRFDDYWPKTYRPFVRYDRYDPNVDISNNQSDAITIGLDVFFAETTKAQLNATRRIDHIANNTPDSSFASNELIFQLQYGF